MKHFQDTFKAWDTPEVDFSGVEGELCHGIDVSNVLTGPHKGQLVIVFDWEFNEDEGYVAYAGPCLGHPDTGRISMGIVVFNLA